MTTWDHIPDNIQRTILGLAFPLGVEFDVVMDAKRTCREFYMFMSEIVETQMEWRRMAHEEDPSISEGSSEGAEELESDQGFATDEVQRWLCEYGLEFVNGYNINCKHLKYTTSLFFLSRCAICGLSDSPGGRPLRPSMRLSIFTRMTCRTTRRYRSYRSRH